MQRRDNDVQGACIPCISTVLLSVILILYCYTALLINVTCELLAYFPPLVPRWGRCLILTVQLKYCRVTKTYHQTIPQLHRGKGGHNYFDHSYYLLF